MADMNFTVEVKNLDKLRQALNDYPKIAEPILQRAVVATQALLAKNTNPSTVPMRSRYLLQNWGFDIGRLFARWYPKASYAPYVEFGTRPHDIRPVTKRALANRETGQIFGRLVHHPGTKPNPFIERIMAAAQPEIDALFDQALNLITAQIAGQAA